MEDQSVLNSYLIRLLLELVVGLYVLSYIKYWRTDWRLIASLLSVGLPLVYLAVIHTLIFVQVMTVDQSRDFTGWVGVILFTGFLASLARMHKLLLDLIQKVPTQREL